MDYDRLRSLVRVVFVIFALIFLVVLISVKLA